MKAQTLTIVGTDRIGSSVGLAVKASGLALSIVGHDRYRERAEAAKALGAVDRLEWNLVNAVAQADIVVLNVPLSELEDTLKAIGEDVQPHALVLDFGSLKSPARGWAERYLRSGHYLGAMPVLAADHLVDGRDTVESASADLFRNSLFCLTPVADADPQAVATAVNFGSLLGAVPYFLDPSEYDSLASGVETLPGLVAAAMFGAVHSSEGWRDRLRFANRSFGTATQPLAQGADMVYYALHDKEATLRWLDALLNELNRWRKLVEDGDREVLELAVEDLQRKREAWLAERAENDWVDLSGSIVDSPNLSEQLLGSWLTGLGGRDRDRKR